MTSLTVIVAPPGRLAGVRDSLQDLSGAGLIDPFLWVEPSMTVNGTFAALLVERGRLTGTSLAALAGARTFDQIRVAVLVPALAGVTGVPEAVEQSVAEFLESSFHGARVTRVRAIISRVGEAVQIPDLVVEGWHNIVLSPEDADGPGVGSNQLHVTTDSLDLGVHAAASLAGILALWTGVDTSVLDSAQILPGSLVRLSRSYFRKLDTTALEATLRSQVLSMTDGLPLPTQFGTSILSVEDTALAARTMADQLWLRHPGVLRGPRESAPNTPPKPISAGEALRMFFGFLWAALKNAPRAWAVGLINRVRSSAASSVHHLVFGSAPSAYAVVVGGVTADGLPASWLDLSDAATALDRLLDDPSVPREHTTLTNLGMLWQDFASGALTLADAGERVTGLNPVQIGSQRAVVREAERIVPDDAQEFSDIPAHLAASIEITSVAPFDVLGTFALEARLRQAAAQPIMGVSASASLQQLQSWKHSHSESFAAQIGARIGESFYATAAEAKALLSEIRDAANADGLLAQIETKQKRIAKFLRVLTAVTVVSIGIVVALFASQFMDLTTLLVIGGAMLVAWFASVLGVFFHGQRELFALINARRVLMSREALARVNLPLALADSRRLGEAYAQYLLWCRIIGTVLRSPFGTAPTKSYAAARDLAGLPMSIRLGTAAVEETTLAAVTNEIRRDIYSVGWLTASWEAAVSGAHEAIGPRGIELKTEPLRIFRQRGTGADSLLSLWVDALAARGVDSSVGDSHWSTIVAEFEDARQELASSLLARVRESIDRAKAPTTYADFMGLVDAPGKVGFDRLANGLLNDGARARGASTVESTSSFGSRKGLGRSVCLTQFSAAFPAYDLLSFAASKGSQIDLLPELFDGMPF
jgi:hypothetical protein